MDVVIVGAGLAAASAIESLRERGHAGGITLIGAHTYARPKVESHGGWWTEVDDIKAQMVLNAHGRVCLSPLVEETFSPDEAPEVYKRLAENKSFPIAQFDWRK